MSAAFIQDMERAALFARLDRFINDIEQAALANDAALVKRTADDMHRLVTRMTRDCDQCQDLTARMIRFANRAQQSLRQTAETLDQNRRAARRDKARMIAYARANGLVV